MSDGALPIGLRESLLRNLLRMVDMLPGGYLLGFCVLVISPENKRLGDWVAGTLVVREDRPLAAPRVAAARDDAAAARFRFGREELEAVGPDERRLIRQTLRRAEGLRSMDRERMLTRTVDVLCRRMERAEAVAPEERVDFLRALLRDAEAAAGEHV